MLQREEEQMENIARSNRKNRMLIVVGKTKGQMKPCNNERSTFWSFFSFFTLTIEEETGRRIEGKMQLRESRELADFSQARKLLSVTFFMSCSFSLFLSLLLAIRLWIYIYRMCGILHVARIHDIARPSCTNYKGEREKPKEKPRSMYSTSKSSIKS